MFPAWAPRAAGLGDFRSVWPPGPLDASPRLGLALSDLCGVPSSGPFGKRRSGLRLPCQAVKGPVCPVGSRPGARSARMWLQSR